jgi:hypothetical protein
MNQLNRMALAIGAIAFIAGVVWAWGAKADRIAWYPVRVTYQHIVYGYNCPRGSNEVMLGEMMANGVHYVRCGKLEVGAPDNESTQ